MFPPSSETDTLLYRVDTPNVPGALSTSAYGSTLLSPPDSNDWRPTQWAVVDQQFPLLPTTSDDSSTSLLQGEEVLEAIQAQAWHDVGFTGQNVKVAIFDIEWMGAEWYNPELETVETHDCFAHPSCNLPINSADPRLGFERGIHGIACAEVIRDIAPDSEIHLVRVLGLTSLENAVDWAIREKMDVISMSLSFFNESFYDGTGPVNDLMDRLHAHDVLMITSAGNYARGHYRSQFVDGDLDLHHDFEDPRGLPIYWTPGRRSIQLLWDGFDSCGWDDLNAYLWSREGELIGKSLKLQDPNATGCHPSETISVEIEVEQWTFLTIENSGIGSPKFDIMARGGYVYNSHRDGSIVDPGNHPSIITVGAVRIDDYLNQEVESFSSFGPTNNGLNKPEIVAPDGITTAAYGSKNFFGTSASTPVTAGAFALYKSRHLSTPNYTLKEELLANTLQGPNYHPEQMGQGLLRLPSPELDNFESKCATNGTFPCLLLLYTFLKNNRHRM